MCELKNIKEILDYLPVFMGRNVPGESPQFSFNWSLFTEAIAHTNEGSTDM